MSIINLNRYYTYEDYILDACKLRKRYKNRIKVWNMGYSLEDRKILLFKVGEGSRKIAISAGVHGRENINTIVLMKILEDFCKVYKKLYEKYTIYFIPLVNPDGYEIALNPYPNRTDLRKDELFLWKGNSRGIDINRNFPCKSWKNKFHNDRPASEPETKCLINFFDKCKPDIYIDIHSRGNEIYYYRNMMDNNYNNLQFKIAKRINKYTGYNLVIPNREIEQNDSGGNTVHYFSEHYKKPAITLETVEEQADFPLEVVYQTIVYNEIKNIIKIL